MRQCSKPTEERVSRLTSAATTNIDVLDHAVSETAIGRKLGIDTTKKLPGEGFKRPRPLIKTDECVRKKIDALFGNAGDKL